MDAQGVNYMRKKELSKTQVYNVLSRYFDLGECDSYRLKTELAGDGHIVMYMLIPSSIYAADYALSVCSDFCMLLEGDGFNCMVVRTVICPLDILDDVDSESTLTANPEDSGEASRIADSEIEDSNFHDTLPFEDEGAFSDPSDVDEDLYVCKVQCLDKRMVYDFVSRYYDLAEFDSYYLKVELVDHTDVILYTLISDVQRFNYVLVDCAGFCVVLEVDYMDFHVVRHTDNFYANLRDAGTVQSENGTVKTSGGTSIPENVSPVLDEKANCIFVYGPLVKQGNLTGISSPRRRAPCPYIAVEDLKIDRRNERSS